MVEITSSVECKPCTMETWVPGRVLIETNGKSSWHLEKGSLLSKLVSANTS